MKGQKEYREIQIHETPEGWKWENRIYTIAGVELKKATGLKPTRDEAYQEAQKAIPAPKIAAPVAH